MAACTSGRYRVAVIGPSPHSPYYQLIILQVHAAGLMQALQSHWCCVPVAVDPAGARGCPSTSISNVA